MLLQGAKSRLVSLPEAHFHTAHGMLIRYALLLIYWVKISKEDKLEIQLQKLPFLVAFVETVDIIK